MLTGCLRTVDVTTVKELGLWLIKIMELYVKLKYTEVSGPAPKKCLPDGHPANIINDHGKN